MSSYDNVKNTVLIKDRFQLSDNSGRGRGVNVADFDKALVHVRHTS
jgi:hypothetical protein